MTSEKINRLIQIPQMKHAIHAEAAKACSKLTTEYHKLKMECDHKYPDGTSAVWSIDSVHFKCSFCGTRILGD